MALPIDPNARLIPLILPTERGEVPVGMALNIDCATFCPAAWNFFAIVSVAGLLTVCGFTDKVALVATGLTTAALTDCAGFTFGIIYIRLPFED
jgi:hypothetical protein